MSKKGDPLSRYFKDLNESDIDSDSDDDDADKPAEPQTSQQQNKEDEETNTATASNSGEDTSTNSSSVDQIASPNSKSQSVQKLPSAIDCFGNKSNPTFLNLDRKKEVDWDHSTNLKLLDSDDNNQILDYKSNAVPPPTSYDPVTDSSIKVVDSEGRKRKSSADERAEQTISSKTCRLDEGTTQNTEAVKS